MGGRRLNISGQAFGVGALEEADDDIYAQGKFRKKNLIKNSKKKIL